MRGPAFSAVDRIADIDLTPEQRLVRHTLQEFAEGERLLHVEEPEREAFGQKIGHMVCRTESVRALGYLDWAA